jgi:rhodanese-related sulfurtransferase
MEGSTKETVSVEDAREEIAGEAAQPVDIRDDEAWVEAHVPGAIHIPTDRLDDLVDQLSKDDRLIVVGDKSDNGESMVASLRERGFDAAAIDGGMEAWMSKNFTIQPSDDPDSSDDPDALRGT